MRRPVRPSKRRAKRHRHLSLSARDSEWAVVSRNAAKLGLSKARYLVGLVERDAAEEEEKGPFMALSAEEQRALLEAVRAIHALMLEDAPGGEAAEAPAEGAASPAREPAPPAVEPDPPVHTVEPPPGTLAPDAAEPETPAAEPDPAAEVERSPPDSPAPPAPEAGPPDAPELPEPRQPRLL